MAVTSIWNVNDSLNRVITYVSNKDKTTVPDNSDYHFNGLSQVINYTSQDLKTEKQLYVSGINCSYSTALSDMQTTKKGWNKEDGILAFHAIQSFAPGEVNAETAHQCGLELANAMWGDRFEVLVSTHLDKAHYHNHFVINSVSFVDGKRYYDNKENYYRMRKLSDEICKKYDLSVIYEPRGKGTNHMVHDSFKGKGVSKWSIVKADVDYCINNSRTITQFQKNLESLGYKFRYPITRSDIEYISVEAPGFTKRIRLDKIPPAGSYTKEGIIERILENETIKWESMNSESFTSHVMKQADEHNKKHKYHGLKALFIKYQFMLGILPKNASYKAVHFYFKEDLLYLDKISKESELMAKHDIETVDDLNNFISDLENQISILESYRKTCYSKIERCKDPSKKEMLIKDRENYNKDIKQLRKDVELCKDILIRSNNAEEKINAIEMEEENERIRRDSRSNGKNDSTRD